MSLAPCCNPGELVPATGRFVLVDVFGKPLDDLLEFLEGDTFPLALRAFQWKLVREPVRDVD